LVEGGLGAVLDPYVSFDGKSVYYAKVHDQTNLHVIRKAARSGADIFKIDLETRAITQLTFQEWTPNTGVAHWSDDPVQASAPGKKTIGYGVYNLGPCPLPGGKIMFTSSRNAYLPNKSFTFPNLQLFVMDDDGSNVEQIGYLNLGSALHPTILTDGRVMFSSYEAQGIRDRRLWGLWSIWPDGQHWEPLMSAVTQPSAFHFQTELSNREIAVVEYYNQNNNGFGTLLSFFPSAPAGQPFFGDPNPSDPSNPDVLRGIWFFNPEHPAHLRPRYKRYPFSPPGLQALSGFTHGSDNASSLDLNADYAGKVTHPSGAPYNDVLLVWSPGPANHLNRPTNRPAYDAGLYILGGGVPTDDQNSLVLVKNDPAYNEQQPKAVVPYRDIYGIDQPVDLGWLPNDGTQHVELPAGTPYGLVGTSSFYRRDTKPGRGSALYDGLDAFNAVDSSSQHGSNWSAQGADAGTYGDQDIYAVRIIGLEPTSHVSNNPHRGDAFRNHADERMRILGEIPLRKFDTSGNPILDPDGNPDTSFLAKLPADVPFTFHTIDKDGMTLNNAQTWHQVRPGEVRNDCGGCHAHSQTPLDFASTAAAKADYVVTDLANTTPMLAKDGQNNTLVTVQNTGAVDVEYYRDIKPILERSCVQCHSLNGPQEAQLVLDDTAIVNGYENTYHRLANDSQATYGIPPVIRYDRWFSGNQSRYVRAFQARRSLLIWKILGRRTDGWTNADFPSAAVPGDPTTLPDGGTGTDDLLADIDFSGTICPPPGSGIPALSEAEKMTFTRWVDLGAPIHKASSDEAAFGWFTDEVRPTLAISSPRPEQTADPLQLIRIGLHDFNTGLDIDSFSVQADFTIDGMLAGTELASLFSQTGDHIWTYTLQNPIDQLSDAELFVSIKDNQGNTTSQHRRFSVGAATQPQGPKLRIAMFVHTLTNAGADVQFSYSIGGDQSEVAHVHFQLDAQPAVADDDQDGQFSFANVAPGTHTIAGYLSRSDASMIAGSADSISFQIQQSVNTPPVITPISDVSLEAGNPVTFTINVTDPDANDTLTLTPTNLPPGATIQHSGPATWTLTWQTTPDDAGTFTLSFAVNDGTTDSPPQAVTITLNAPVVEVPTTLTLPLVTRDQHGQAIENAEIYVYQKQTWFQHGTTLELDVGEKYLVRGRLGSIQGAWLDIVVDAAMQELLIPFQTVTLTAQDQMGQMAASVNTAQLHVYKLAGSPFAPGTTISLPQGAKTLVRGQKEGILGPWINVRFDEGTQEVVVPFQTLPLVALDQTGASVSGAQLHVYKLNGGPFVPGTVISVPQGAKTLVRGQLAGIKGPWINVQFEAGLTEVVVPFWTATFAAVDATGNALNETQFAVYKLDGTFLSGELLTLPKESKALIRARIAGQRQSWQTFIFSEGLDEIAPDIS
jgi:hypothetical protein